MPHRLTHLPAYRELNSNYNYKYLVWNNIINIPPAITGIIPLLQIHYHLCNFFPICTQGWETAECGLSEWNYVWLEILTALLGEVRFEVFMAVTMKNAVLWDLTPCDSIIRVNKISEPGMSAVASNCRKLQTDSETSFPIKATRRYIPEDGILFRCYFEKKKTGISCNISIFLSCCPLHTESQIT
jgi:hypothetical protein